MSFIIHAPNIHRGGGKTLLLDLLDAIRPDDNCLLLADQRLDAPSQSKKVEILSFPPTLIGRLRAEHTLTARAKADDVVLCLGNLPPVFRLRARNTVLFLQNRYLLDALNTSGLPLGARFRIAAERRWLRARVGHVQRIIVQSRSMADAVMRSLMRTAEIAPFAGIRTGSIGAKQRCNRSDPIFLYVASGEPHKNHRRLIEAWTLLAHHNIRPMLRLTLDPACSAELLAWIDHQRKTASLNIENAGQVDSLRLQDLYLQANALIYPSIAESMGLPLVEAQAIGLPVIAPELDFVRDLITPTETFDPDSALSIARAIKRFLNIPDHPPVVRSPGEFLNLLIAE